MKIKAKDLTLEHLDCHLVADEGEAVIVGICFFRDRVELELTLPHGGGLMHQFKYDDEIEVTVPDVTIVLTKQEADYLSGSMEKSKVFFQHKTKEADIFFSIANKVHEAAGKP